jgi:serine protease
MPRKATAGGRRKKQDTHPLRLAVKINNRAGKPPQELDGWQRSLERADPSLGALRLLPLIESQKPESLNKLVDLACRNDPHYEPPDFSTWFQVVTPQGVNADELAKALRRLDIVETAYVMRPGPPPVTPGDDPRNANQGYEDAAPNGIDARYAWGFAGGNGAGIGFVDMEQGWNLNHEDLAAAGITIISGINNAYFFHGTSVLGEVLMVDNTVGGVGIAPSATGRVVSQQRTAASYNTPDAIHDAVAHMAFGDVLLLEAQEYDPVGGLYYWPVEIADATYDAIRLASALGIVVVEAGCNGGYDLDAYTSLSGHRIFDRTSADFRDSGAIMVGAGSSAAPHTRLGFSNHGNRIDCYGWGENIDTTTTDGTGTNNTIYTTTFNGTSGASPIVVGAALIVQGIARASLGYRFSPRELRGILTTNGTPSANPPVDRIGVMPDLRAIITNNQINLAPDLYLRDYVGDSGNPTSGTVSISPDIIVRQAAVATPQFTYGAGSGTENDPALSQDVDTGHNNFVYVRVLNRGGSIAANVEVDIYWSPPSTLVSPNLWNFIGTAVLPSVPVGNVLTVANGITWPAASIPGPGHYCFVAVAGNAQDPKPAPSTFSSWDQFVNYVTNNNNIAWRNFDVVPGPPSAGPPPGFYELDFIVAGAFDTSHRFELEAEGRLPEGSRVFLDVPVWLADSLRPHPCEVKQDSKREMVRVPLHPFGLQRLGSAVLHAKSTAKCQLRVQIPEKQRLYAHEFAVRQLYKKIEVGRLTWRFPAFNKNQRQKKYRPKRKR